MERNKIWCWLISCNTNDSNSRRYVGIDRIAAKRSDAGNIHPQTDVVANVRKIHNQAILISKARRSLATALSVHLGKVCGEWLVTILALRSSEYCKKVTARMFYLFILIAIVCEGEDEECGKVERKARWQTSVQWCMRQPRSCNPLNVFFILGTTKRRAEICPPWDMWLLKHCQGHVSN